MNTYLVTWEMEIDADSPIEAAEQARLILRNPQETLAGVFSVMDEHGQATEVDLDHELEREAITEPVQ